MIAFGIIIGVIAIIGIVYAIASTFTKKFDRKFIFARTVWGILFGEILCLVGYAVATDLSGLCDDLSVELISLITFTPAQCIIDGGGLFDVGSGVFVFGLLVVLGAWYTNIYKSNIVWGMAQNILQTILVTVYSVVIVVGTFLVKEALQKPKGKA